MDKRVAFLDTTVFLHYQPIDQMDWLNVLNTRRAILIVTGLVIRQLNKHKHEPRNTRKRRERAGSALKRLESHSETNSPVMLRDSVELQFMAKSPVLDFAAHKLSPLEDDDWLIASMLEFRGEASGADIVLVTDDLGLKLKAKGHGIPTVRLPETFKLPEEPDPDQRRIRELEEKLRQYQFASPDLKLALGKGRTYLRVVLKRPSVSPAIMEERMREVRQHYPKVEKGLKGLSGADLMRGSILAPLAIDAHNKKLENFYTQYQKYLEAKDRFDDRKKRLIRLEIRLVNDGGSPAEDINVFINFPAGFRLLLEQQLPKPPDKPEPPQPPKTITQQIVDGSLLSLNQLTIPNLLSDLSLSELPRFSIEESPVTGPYVSVQNSNQVEVHVRKLKHKFHMPFSPVYVQFDTWESVKPFGIEYVINAGNISEEIRGTLHVVVELEK